MPEAKIIHGRYSVIIERDSDDPKKPPCNPCKCCCKGARDVAAKYWAIFNMIMSVKYSFLKIIDVVIWVGGIDVFGWGQKYHAYLESLYCTESSAATSASIILDAMGQLDSTIGSALFLIAVLCKKKDLHFRLRLSRWQLINVCITFLVFLTSKVTVVIASIQYDEHVICSSETYHKTSIIIWCLSMAAWLHVSASSTVSFMYWLETKIKEQDQHASQIQDQLKPQQLLKEAMKERQSMSSNKSVDDDKKDPDERLRGFSISDGLFPASGNSAFSS